MQTNSPSRIMAFTFLTAVYGPDGVRNVFVIPVTSSEVLMMHAPLRQFPSLWEPPAPSSSSCGQTPRVAQPLPRGCEPHAGHASTAMRFWVLVDALRWAYPDSRAA